MVWRKQALVALCSLLPRDSSQHISVLIEKGGHKKAATFLYIVASEHYTDLYRALN